MDRSRNKRVAIVWRGLPSDGPPPHLAETRFAAVAAALDAVGLAAEPCLYDEASEQAFAAQLSGAAAAMVFVNPLQDGRRRQGLDRRLREAASAGVLVSAHPDVIDKLGVKSVLWRTRELGWSSDVHFHAEAAEFARDFPDRLALGPRVLKPNRGNGGQGVWKVEAAPGGLVRVERADGEPLPAAISLPTLLEARGADFTDAGGVVDQAWQPRIGEGMVRCYMAGNRAAGFGVQKVKALAPSAAGPGGPRLYSGADDPRFQRLRRLMERTWTPGLCRILAIEPADLPVIWDADFMLGPRTPEGEDGYVLCEINASSVFPIPEQAPAAMAALLADRLAVE